MRYEGNVFRPPSEAYSLIVQVTIGCAHNLCTFCSMYKDKKFRIRDINEVLEDLDMARRAYRRVCRGSRSTGIAPHPCPPCNWGIIRYWPERPNALWRAERTA